MKLCKFISGFGLYLLLLSTSPMAISAPADGLSEVELPAVSSPSGHLLLAAGEVIDLDEETPRPGTLVLPATADEEKTEKKCMTVCKRWGQECMIDPTRGVRKCRRTCKEFGQECF